MEDEPESTPGGRKRRKRGPSWRPGQSPGAFAGSTFQEAWGAYLDIPSRDAGGEPCFQIMADRAVDEPQFKWEKVKRGRDMVLRDAYEDGRLAAREGRRCLPMSARSRNEFLREWRRGYLDQQAEAADAEGKATRSLPVRDGEQPESRREDGVA